jgi:hypothetical protein
VRPDFTTEMGLARVIRRDSSTNRPGLPKLSRYIRTMDVCGSCSQNSRQSFPLTSALFPADTNDDTPIPRLCA